MITRNIVNRLNYTRCYSTSIASNLKQARIGNQTQERGNPVSGVPPQSDNRATKWSPRQRAKEDAFVGPRFEQTNLAYQPNPKAAIELIAESVDVCCY